MNITQLVYELQRARCNRKGHEKMNIIIINYKNVDLQ